MKLEVFEMERFQSIWENTVNHNLSESGVHPMSLGELIEPGDRDALFDKRFVYVQTNGTPALRESIAALYPGATAGNVVVGNGTAEANYMAVWRLVEPGDEVVMMLPNYMQIWGIVRGQGRPCIPWAPADEEQQWEADVEELASLVTPRTKLIALCNPNNPTGSILSEAAMRAVVAVAEKVGAWVHRRRGLPWRRTRRTGEPQLLGPVRARAGDIRAEQGVWPSGVANRLGSRRPPASSANCGRARTI